MQVDFPMLLRCRMCLETHDQRRRVTWHLGGFLNF